MESLSYRPRNAGHNYYGRGTYLITLVVSGRERLLSGFATGFATVIVTPGISRGEQLMKNECIERGLPLIHLQSIPIGPFWKPEIGRFDACARGALLILAPWDLDTMGDVGKVPSASDYSRFHNMNTLAAGICAFTGEARIMK